MNTKSKIITKYKQNHITTPLDLFYVDPLHSPTDLAVTIQLTNANELVHCYLYLILKMGIYVQRDSGEWEKASYDGKPISETFISMLNGQVSFTSAGFTKYDIGTLPTPIQHGQMERGSGEAKSL